MIYGSRRILGTVLKRECNVKLHFQFDILGNLIRELKLIPFSLCPILKDGNSFYSLRSWFCNT